MLHKIYIAAAFFACSWGCGQTIAQERVEVEPPTVEALSKTVSELTARIEALEELLFKMQSNGVAPEFERAIQQLKELPNDKRAQPKQVRQRGFYNGIWLNGVDAGMMIDAFEHGIRWREAVPSNGTIGLPQSVPLEVEGPTILRNSPRR